MNKYIKAEQYHKLLPFSFYFQIIVGTIVYLLFKWPGLAILFTADILFCLDEIIVELKRISEKQL